MRKILFLCAAVFLLAGTVLAGNRKPDYFPCPVGMTWEYAVTSSVGEKLKLKSVVKSVNGDQITIETRTPQPSVMVYTRGEWIVLNRLTTGSQSVSYEPPRPQLKVPVMLGQSWEYQGQAGSLKVTQSSRVASRREWVTVPVGRFLAVKVTHKMTHGPSGVSETRWLADGVGVVKTESQSAPGLTSTSELVNYSRPGWF